MDRPQAQLAARLCDIWPDGAATRITGGVLNLSHRNSHENPEELEPGAHYQVDVELKAIAYVCPRGHRLRLSISAGSWPLAWPAPETFTLSAHLGSNTVVELQVIDDPSALEGCPEHFSQPESAAPVAHESLPVPGGLPPIGLETRDRDTGTIAFVTSARPRDHHVRRLDSGLEWSELSRDTFSIKEGEPLSASVKSHQQLLLARGSWQTRVETSSTMSATRDHFLVTNELEAYEGDVRVFTKAWHSTIPRDHT